MILESDTTMPDFAAECPRAVTIVGWNARRASEAPAA
jgi:hypothetical protein